MPTFEDVSLLLPFDGADGSTTFTDFSNTELVLTAQGNAQIDTAQSKWGGASLLLSGGTDAVAYTALSSAFAFSSDWTCEAWVRLSQLSSSHGIFDLRYSGDTSAPFMFIQNNGCIAMQDVSIYGAVGTPLVVGTWHHVAWCRSGTTLRLFLDGVVQATATYSRNLSASRTLRIGRSYSTTNFFPFFGHIDDVRITKAAQYTANFTPPIGPHDTGVPQGLLSEDNGLLQQPSLNAGVGRFGFIAESGLLQPLRCLANHDFTAQIDTAVPTMYVMDLNTPGGLVRVPISSWQATLQTDVQSYVQCVIPAATAWVPDIEAATEFVISRVGTLLNGSPIEYEMARAPAQTVSLDGGAYNYTATVSGYTAAMDAVEDPPAALDRTLTGVRTVSRNSGNVRVRCNIDWLLRPGQRAYLNDEPIVVSYVNYYVPGFDQYMDVGDRAA